MAGPGRADQDGPGDPGAATREHADGRAALKRARRAAVAGEVRFDPGTLALYANDASSFRQVAAVALPVLAVLATAAAVIRTSPLKSAGLRR